MEIPKQCTVVDNEEKGFTVELFTNNFEWSASTIEKHTSQDGRL